MRLFAGCLLLALALGCDGARPVDPGLELSFRQSEAPSGTNLLVVSYNRIDVSWQDNSPNETGFELDRAPGANGAFSILTTTGASAKAFADGSVSAQSQYCYKVRAFRTTGRNTTYSEFSNTACATTPPLPSPAVPSGTSAVPMNSSAIHVTWADNSSDETGFRAEFSLDGGTSWQFVGYTLSANTTQFDQWGRVPDQPVCYRIIALGSLANSVPSNVDCTAPPLAPDQLRGAGVSGPAIDLSWRDNSTVEDGYEVRRADPSGQSVVVGNLAAAATSFHDVNVAVDTRYTYSVAAKKDGGYSDFASVSAMTVSVPPSAPLITGVFPQSSSSIALYWSEQSQNLDGFRIEFSADGGSSWSQAGTALWYETSFWHYGLISDQLACYRVVAFNGAGEAASGMACATPPAAPTNLIALTAVGAGQIDLTWTDNSSKEDGYQVQEVSSNCGYYYYYCYPSYSVVATLAPNTTSFQVTGLYPSELHTYVVAALKDGGTSDLSNEAGAYAGPSGP